MKGKGKDDRNFEQKELLFDGVKGQISACTY